MARPQWGGEMVMMKRRGIDVMVAVDVSNSMLAQDVKPNRLERAKLAVLDMVKLLEGDRVGLVAFAGTAFLECPLTLDDLRDIRRAFVDVLRGLQHPRITYPTEAMLAQPSAQPALETPPQPGEPVAGPAKEERRGPTTNRDSGASRAV